MDIVINADIASIPDSALQIPHQANFYHNILTCLDPSFSRKRKKVPKADEGLHPPIAHLLSQYHGLKGDWLIASPIHWQATHNDAMMTASGHELELSDEESHRWFDALSDFLAPLNQQLYYHDAYTWLIQCDGKPQITAKPVHHLQHQSMMPELKALDKTLQWQRFITETQMFLSAHPLNKARAGLAPINGIWLWGAGQLGDRTPAPLICDDPNLHQLAGLLSLNVIHQLPAGKPTKNSVFLFNHLSETDRILLQQQLQSYTVRWYWNNIAYLSKPKHWWSRIMEI